MPLEFLAPATIAIEVYIERRLSCNCRVCIDMCPRGVFDCVDHTVLPVRMHLCITPKSAPPMLISTGWTVRA